MAPPRLTPTHSSGLGGMAGGLGYPKIWVLVAIGNKFGNRLVMVTREFAKLDTRFLPELMLTVNKNSNKLSAFLPILALGIVVVPALAGRVDPTSVSCDC
ncbi:hypothetical protein [Microcoleus asticus]|uniref:Uncharacterized protein n=1 Tax=Microcoleus asticus IPMA8 TaxID=2563858 RepID=A0ABX2CUA5_9CYAN|nr:hypothetical protein [Microcoleus asticus]NQE33287.1 hypothetical protein [Microcoleus asticus IPMA8]